MNESYVIIETDQEYLLTDILVEFADLYIDTKFPKNLKLYRKEGSQTYFLVQFETAPDLNHFGYLVNYLKYPIDHDNFKARVKGFFLNNKELLVNVSSSKWLMFFNCEHDAIPPDAVSFVTLDNSNYLLDFGGSIKAQTVGKELFNQPIIELDRFHHIKDIFPSISSQKSSKSKAFIKTGISELLSDILAIIVCFMFSGAMIIFGDTDFGLYWLVVGFFGLGGLFMLWKVIFPGKYEAMKYSNRKK